MIIIKYSLCALLVATPGLLRSQVLTGRVDDDIGFGSSQLTLQSPLNLRLGDKLVFSVTGGAARVVVRALPTGEGPQKDRIIIDDRAAVVNGVVTIVVKQDVAGTVALSVHGGPKPWNKYDLGIGNGPAFITSVRLVPRNATGGKSDIGQLQLADANPFSDCSSGGSARVEIASAPVLLQRQMSFRLSMRRIPPANIAL
jgi:hypothetical protein